MAHLNLLVKSLFQKRTDNLWVFFWVKSGGEGETYSHLDHNNTAHQAGTDK